MALEYPDFLKAISVWLGLQELTKARLKNVVTHQRSNVYDHRSAHVFHL